jgi:chemotaxis protein CheD
MFSSNQGKLITVGVADMKVSGDADATLVTYSLGSCLGIMIYDPLAQVGGMLHAMLPESHNEKDNPEFNPFKYIDSGVPQLFKEAYKLGALKHRLKVTVTGGAQILDDSNFFNIGQRNLASLRKLFWKNGILVDREHVGGTVSRTTRLKLMTGAITLTISGEKVIEL